MARTTKAKEEVKIVSGELETKLQSNLKAKKEEVKVDLGAVSVVETTDKEKTPVKMVKILMNENHRCYIGGEWYYLLKDKHYNVPENVKNILMQSNKLRPL